MVVRVGENGYQTILGTLTMSERCQNDVRKSTRSGLPFTPNISLEGTSKELLIRIYTKTNFLVSVSIQKQIFEYPYLYKNNFLISYIYRSNCSIYTHFDVVARGCGKVRGPGAVVGCEGEEAREGGASIREVSKYYT